MSRAWLAFHKHKTDSYQESRRESAPHPSKLLLQKRILDSIQPQFLRSQDVNNHRISLQRIQGKGLSSSCVQSTLCGRTSPLCAGRSFWSELRALSSLVLVNSLQQMEHSQPLTTLNTQSERTEDTQNMVCRGGKPVGSESAWALLQHKLSAPGKSTLQAMRLPVSRP